MTITDKLEGLLPADGPVTDDERVIADAVKELRGWPVIMRRPHWQSIALAFATGCIASAIFVVLV